MHAMSCDDLCLRLFRTKSIKNTSTGKVPSLLDGRKVPQDGPQQNMRLVPVAGPKYRKLTHELQEVPTGPRASSLARLEARY